ncbi:hypothetical protein J2T13_000859 [Paenibacillus sp. DS2015]|uniref:hypothetical protein n=1 Tax=Paenibacillus sp. DS2015 TaxID=3373917 RepID=UPI003D225DEF
MVIKPPPEGWRERISKKDQMIGYIVRRMEDDKRPITYSDVQRLLLYLDDYKSVKQGEND